MANPICSLFWFQITLTPACILCAESVWREFGLHGSLRSKGDVRSWDTWLTHSTSSSCQLKSLSEKWWNQIKSFGSPHKSLKIFEHLKWPTSIGVLVSGQDRYPESLGQWLCCFARPDGWLWGLGLLLESQRPKLTTQRLSEGGPWLRNDESKLRRQYS